MLEKLLMSVVLLTDYAWPDTTIERDIIESAGFQFVAGPARAMPPEDIEALVAQNDPAAIMTCWAEVTAAAISSCSKLAIIARMGVGLDNIDRAAAAAANAVVTNVPDYCVEEVSDHAVGLLLCWARGIHTLDNESKAGRWNADTAHLVRVRDLTIGIVGFGRMGRRTAAKLRPFGVRMLVCSEPPLGEIDADIDIVDLTTLVSQSDVIILHLPLTPKTRDLFGESLFAKTKPGALLINVSRGGLIDNKALLDALDRGHLGGAALDVVDGEPHPPQAVIGHPKVIATPHVAFSSGASIIELRRRAAEEVVRVLRGEPAHYPCPLPASVSKAAAK